MLFHPEKIEANVKEKWAKEKVYRVTNDTSKPKFYVLDMFPYPSGAGLHVGHPLGYIASDIVSRYKRMKGFNVLHPMGYDAFGLPAEQYAIQTGVHPAVSTAENIAKYRSQLDNIGFSYDWERQVNTSEPSYYKWTQWIFIQLFNHYYDTEQQKSRPVSELIQTFATSGNQSVKAVHAYNETFTAEQWANKTPKEKDDILMDYRLAYRTVGYVNWCEALGTVLANDEVKDGLSERGGFPVEKKAMMQWSLRITAYAERLLSELENLEWSDALKTMQRNWIGKSEGARVWFALDGNDESLEIFTTRPDTIFGCTFMVLAPEHDLVKQITTNEYQSKVDEYIAYTGSRSERERMSEVKEVTGVFTGAFAIHPITGDKVPVWIADYVLKDYGTGAIMAVPSDDDRDKAFAEKFGLPIIAVVDKTNYPGAGLHDKVGVMINSGMLNGLEVKKAISTMIDYLESEGKGHKEINYKLRDANFSRQRYWGEPFPILYDADGVAHALEEKDLPLTLPELQNFQPATDGRSPLARAESWVNEVPGYVRETDTMPGFAGSSWYFLRYMDPANDHAFASEDALQYWKDVDLYIGGTEHAVGHLMYSRFWHKFLYDLGKVPTQEPFLKLINQGMITAFGYYIENMNFTRANGTTCYLVGNSSDHIDRPIITQFGDTFEYSYSSRLPYVGEFLDSKNRFYRRDLQRYNDLIKSLNIMVEFPSLWVRDDNGHEFVTVNVVQEKMSKSKFNIINPDNMVEEYGADCFRMYEMFLGPIEQSKPWDTKGIDGVQKFLKKFWSLFMDEGQSVITKEEATAEERKVLHTAIKKVTEDIERFSLNTGVSAFMVCVNELKRLDCHKFEILEPLVRLISPYAPFVSEALWEQLGGNGSVHHAAFPVFEASYLESDTIEYPVCINGKKRDMITIPKDMSQQELEALVMGMDTVQKWLEGAKPKKIIVVPGRMVNLVV